MKNRTRKLVMTGMLSALSAVLMFLSFSVFFMPSFIKLDFSELPALIASFALGPVYGVLVCLVKNIVNLMFTTTGGVGELANFVLGALFVLPAGIVYKYNKNIKGAVYGSLLGSFIMAAASLAVNYFITYPMYFLFMPKENIIAMYRAINNNVNSLFEALLYFNVPYTFFKGVLISVLAFFIYKKISWFIKGIK